MNTPQIVIAEPIGFPKESVALLERSAQVTMCETRKGALLRAVRSADILWIRLAHQIDAEVMAAAPGLKIIVTPTTGLNHIDCTEAERRGIRILSLRGKVDFLKDIRATAEHTIGLMMAIMRNIPAAVADVNAGSWNRDRFQGAELYGKTVGLFGYGRLGKIVARYLKAFDARVLVTDPVVPVGAVDEGIESIEPKELLRESDIVSLHVDLKEGNHRFFDSAMFGAMKQGAYFINTSRGELIDEMALLGQLVSGTLRGAALDVLHNESSRGMSTHALVQYARQRGNLIITPHIGGCTAESMNKTEQFMARELAEVLQQWTDKEILATSC